MHGRRAAVVFVLFLLFLPAGSGAAFESSCVTCHEVDIDARLALPVPEWRESVHARHEVSCDACHGGNSRVEDADASMSVEAGFEPAPGPAEMTEHCGACHEGVADRYRESSASREDAQAASESCASCHMRDGHRVARAGPEELAPHASCPSCAGPARDAARDLLQQLAASRRDLAERIEVVEERGFELADQRESLRETRQQLSLALHRFDSAELMAAAARARQRQAEIRKRLAGFEREVGRRRQLGVGLLGVLALVLVVLFRTSLRNRG